MSEAADTAGHAQPWSMTRVVTASSAGTAFEWYDFFIFGSLTPIISKVFFAGLDPTAALVAALALFAVGFAFRPLGAILFGAMGDRIGRKATFLVTVSLMGGATFAIGLLPTYAQAGIIAPISTRNGAWRTPRLAVPVSWFRWLCTESASAALWARCRFCARSHSTRSSGSSPLDGRPSMLRFSCTASTRASSSVASVER